MPLYEYGCSACGRTSEISHRMSDPPAVDCPLCGKPALSKLVSAAGFRLKGAGWYETDFKSDGKRNLASDSNSVEVKSADSKPDKAEKSASKPAASSSSSSGSGSASGTGSGGTASPAAS